MLIRNIWKMEFYNYDVIYQCTMDEEWHIKKKKALEIYNVYSMDELDEEWAERHPDMRKEGTYYKQVSFEEESLSSSNSERCHADLISEEEFKLQYKEMTGEAIP